MKTKDILELDCRIKENEKIIQRVLRQIKPLAKCSEEEDIPFEKLERCLKVLCTKYNFYPKELYPDVFSGDKDVIWRMIIIDQKDLSISVKCYGRNLYETLCKANIALYAITRKRET